MNWPDWWYNTCYVPNRIFYEKLFEIQKDNPHYEVPVSFTNGISWPIKKVRVLIALHESTLGRALIGKEETEESPRRKRKGSSRGAGRP